MNLSFAAIDFEPATGYMESACAVGIVTVTDGEITDEYYSLIQPPENEYWRANMLVLFPIFKNNIIRLCAN